MGLYCGWYLNGSIGNTDMVNDTPLHRQGWEAESFTLLGQIVQAGIGIAVICLTCSKISFVRLQCTISKKAADCNNQLSKLLENW